MTVLRWLRRSPDEALAADGAILRVGRYENWIRRIAGVGLVYVFLVLGWFFVVTPSRAFASFVGGLKSAALLGLGFVAVAELWARVRGRGMFRRDRWNRNIVWDAWSVLCVLTSVFVNADALLARSILIATMLIPIGASILDRVGLPELPDPKRSTPLTHDPDQG